MAMKFSEFLLRPSHYDTIQIFLYFIVNIISDKY